MSSIPATAREPMPDRRHRFEAVIRHHQTGVWRYLRVLGATADVADDLLQETFLVAWRKGFEDRGPAATATFLRTTARHLLLRRWRQEGRREELLVELADRHWQAEGAADDGEAWLLALRACVGKLPERTRAAVEDWYGTRDRDGIAARHGLQPNGLKTLLQRARTWLRACLEQRQGEDS